MNVEVLTLQEALHQGAAFPWVLVRSLSRVLLNTPLTNPAEFPLKELLEARFFDHSQEIRIFRNQDGLKAIRLQETENDNTIKETYQVNNGALKGLLTLCHVLQADKDGQTYIAATRLAGWKGDNV